VGSKPALTRSGRPSSSRSSRSRSSSTSSAPRLRRVSCSEALSMAQENQRWERGQAYHRRPPACQKNEGETGAATQLSPGCILLTTALRDLYIRVPGGGAGDKNKHATTTGSRSHRRPEASPAGAP